MVKREGATELGKLEDEHALARQGIKGKLKTAGENCNLRPLHCKGNYVASEERD